MIESLRAKGMNNTTMRLKGTFSKSKSNFYPDYKNPSIKSQYGLFPNDQQPILTENTQI